MPNQHALAAQFDEVSYGPYHAPLIKDHPDMPGIHTLDYMEAVADALDKAETKGENIADALQKIGDEIVSNTFVGLPK